MTLIRPVFINKARRSIFTGALLFGCLGLTSCADNGALLGNINTPGRGQRWFTTGEKLRARLRADPDDPEAQSALKELEATVHVAAASPDFKPDEYFYAQAYIDYFDNKNFARSLDNLQQVMIFQLRPRALLGRIERDEILEFMDKAQIQADRELQQVKAKIGVLLRDIEAQYAKQDYDKAMHDVRGILILDPNDDDALEWSHKLESFASKPAVAAGKSRHKIRKPLASKKPAPAPMPDPQWFEDRYREALKFYVNGNAPAASRALHELLRYQPKNDRWQKTLLRIEQELPKSAMTDAGAGGGEKADSGADR